MGQYTSEVLGVVGAVIGGVWGGGNWQIGYAIGSAVGGVIEGPTTIPAPGLNEAPVQTSRDGVPIAKVWGLHQVHGNIIQKNPETQVTTTESQGKGGGTETETTRRFRTFAIGICQGPIHDITRIWENGRLVFDARNDPAIPIEETLKYSEGIRIYYGIEDQLPNPDLEAHWGEDETPHYKGLAYIVWVNKDLTDFAGAIPQFAFEVNGSRDATITSKPYPIEALDGVDVTPSPVEWNERSVPIDGVDASVSLIAWAVNTLLNSTDFTEGVDVSLTPQSWVVEVRLESYDYTEGIDASVTPQGWLVDLRLVSYDYETEGVDASVAPLTWTVAAP